MINISIIFIKTHLLYIIHKNIMETLPENVVFSKNN